MPSPPDQSLTRGDGAPYDEHPPANIQTGMGMIQSIITDLAQCFTFG